MDLLGPKTFRSRSSFYNIEKQYLLFKNKVNSPEDKESKEIISKDKRKISFQQG